jgi:hypothetical protein
VLLELPVSNPKKLAEIALANKMARISPLALEYRICGTMDRS